VPVTAPETPNIKFSPVKRDYKDVDATSPIYGEVSAETTKIIATNITNTYKQTQDSQKSGIGAKATFYADEPKYNPTDISREQRRFNSHKRNLDGELSSVIKGCIDE
jgi:hypothetical protein